MKNENRFIKEFGVQYAKWLIGEEGLGECKVYLSGDTFDKPTTISCRNLKRLVESWELIEKYRINKENINWVLSKLNSNARHRIMQAWVDVESCQ